jgi:putative aldouronate transport system permease protein
MMSRSPMARKILFDLKKNKYLYMMLIPTCAYIFIFRYIPMYGAQIAFKDYSFARGMWKSEWVGLLNFKEFFRSIYAWRVIRNTLLISLYSLIIAFPISIVFALLLNELKNEYFKRIVQTLTYVPYFISLVVVVGMIYDFFARDGVVNEILSYFKVPAIPFMQLAQLFRPLYIGSNIWQQFGWNSIIYLAALSDIDPTLYEASNIDGAGRFKQAIHITLPGIVPVIVIMFLLRIGDTMNVGLEKIILMYNPLVMETADVISSYVYRRGIQEMSYSFSSAVGLFNSIINLSLLVMANKIISKTSEYKLW